MTAKQLTLPARLANAQTRLNAVKAIMGALSSYSSPEITQAADTEHGEAIRAVLTLKREALGHR